MLGRIGMTVHLSDMVPQEAMLRIMTTVFEEQSTTLNENSELDYDLLQICIAFCVYFIRV